MPARDEPKASQEPPKTPAERIAGRAADAAEAAAQKAEDLTEAAQRAAETAEDEGEPHARRCPHCRERMVQHGDENPYKDGAWHCDGCGCCWRGTHLREGHAPCSQASV